VQGRLRNRKLRGTIHSERHCCGAPLAIALDSDLRHEVLTEGASPVASVPTVDLKRLEDPSIIDAF